MKVHLLIPILLLLSVFVFSSCDSPTDSKAVQVSAPSLVYPANNDTIEGFSVRFQWTGSADRFQISCYPSFSQCLYDANISGTSCNVDLTGYDKCGNTYTYYWRAGSSMGGNVYWSELTYHFTIKH